MARKRIGELLLERRAITQAQLDQALLAQQRSGGQRLGMILVSLGAISEVQLAQVLAESLTLTTVDLKQVQVDWSAVHMLRAPFCETHGLFPFGLDGKGTSNRRLMVAMSDPLNRTAVEEIEFTTGLRAAPYVTTLGQVRAAILRYYHKGAPQAAVEPPARARPEEPPMVMGQELPQSTPRPSIPPQRSNPAPESVASDLDFLLGTRRDEESEVEKMERRFWALLRILQRKGVLTRDEFMKELEREQP